MAIYALQSADHLERQLDRMDPMRKMLQMEETNGVVAAPEHVSFLDIFKGMVNNVIETDEQVQQDKIDLMLGNIDDLATVQANLTKANIAVDLLVSVKNEVVSSYNNIINMQI